MIPGRIYSVEDLVAIAWARKWALIAPFALVAMTTVAISQSLPDRYRSETLILVVPQRIPEAYVRSTITAPRIEDRLPAITQQILSRTRLERIIQDFGLYADLSVARTKEDIIAKMRNEDVGVQPVEGDAFRVSYQADNPTTARNVADRLAALFIEENLRDREVLARGASAFLESQLEDARRRLVEHEKQIEQYRREHAGQLPSQLESNLQVIQNTQVQLQLLADSLNRDRDRRLLVDRGITDLSAELDLVAAGAAAAGTTAGDMAPRPVQLEAAKSTLQALERRLKAEHPDVSRQKRLIQDLERAIEVETKEQPASTASKTHLMTASEINRRNRLREMQAELDSLDRQIAYKTDEERRLRSLVADYQTRVEAAPSRESELTALTRDYETLRASYTSLLAKGEDSKIAENLERRKIGEQFKVLDPANLPERPFRPNRPLINLMGVFAGLVLGVGIVALLEYRDVSLKTEADVLAALSLPILAMIPALMTAAERVTRRRKRLALCVAVAAAVLFVAVIWVRIFRA